MIKLKINGREIVTETGTTVLEAAQFHGISIPNLCAAKGLTSYGGCRLCLVEIKGRRGYVPACCTAVEENLEITTETPQLRELRRLTLELILSEHPHACLICTEKKSCEEYKSTIRKVGEVTGCVLCPENGQCRLQEVVEELKVERVRFPASYRNFEVRREDPFFDRNYNLCILCARCVRVCAEVRGASAVTVVFRGPQAVIGTALDRPLLDSGCQFCGACIDVCPTGSLTERALKGEGLPDETRRTICPLCSVGCTLEVGLRKGRVISSFPKDGDTVNNGQACVKGRFVLRDVVHTPRRVLRPMLRRHGELVEVNWDEALDLVAQRLTAKPERGPAFVVSSQLCLEDQYVARKFARSVLNADPVLDSPSPSTPSAYRRMLQEQGFSPQLNFELASLSAAGVILAAGTDLALSHPILWVNVLKAVQKGAKLIVWNPGQSSLDRWAAFTLRTKPGCEPAVLGHLSRWLLEHRPKDQWTSIPGYEELKASLEQASSAGAIPSAGLTAEEVQAVACLLDEARPGVFLCGPGLVGRPAAAGPIWMLWNLAQMVGARVIPLALENNERGLVELWPSGAANGLSLGQVVQEVEKGRIQSLYLAGRFPPLGESRPDFLIVQDCYRGANNKLADVVLPAATWAEAEGTFVNVEGRIQKYKRLLDPLGESKPDWWIFCRLAEKMGSKDFVYQSSAEIAEEMSKLLPSLHEASSHHLKKGRPSFVLEDRKSASRFIPLASSGGTARIASDSPASEGGVDIPDYYRGLNLCEEVKGLRRLREKTKTLRPKTGRIERGS
jgi:predicted molibdopterin-dependent oxidoreductase YjgC